MKIENRRKIPRTATKMDSTKGERNRRIGVGSEKGSNGREGTRALQ